MRDIHEIQNITDALIVVVAYNCTKENVTINSQNFVHLNRDKTHKNPFRYTSCSHDSFEKCLSYGLAMVFVVSYWDCCYPSTTIKINISVAEIEIEKLLFLSQSLFFYKHAYKI